MLVNSHVQLIVALRQVDGEKTVVSTLTLCYKGTRDRILNDDLSTADVGFLFRIVGKLVGYINNKRTSLVGHGRDAEIDVSTITILAVNAKTTRDRHIELHVGSRHQAQYNVNCIVLIQSWHHGTSERLHPFGQREADRPRVALTVVGDDEAIVAPGILVHRGGEVLRLYHEIACGCAGIIVNRNLKISALGRGDTNLELLPVITRSGYCTCYLIGHIDRRIAGDIRCYVELGIATLWCIQHFGGNASQRQCSGIHQTDDAILGFSNRHIAGDIGIVSTLQSEDIEGCQFLNSGIALEAGTYGEVTRL